MIDLAAVLRHELAFVVELLPCRVARTSPLACFDFVGPDIGELALALGKIPGLSSLASSPYR